MQWVRKKRNWHWWCCQRRRKSYMIKLCIQKRKRPRRYLYIYIYIYLFIYLFIYWQQLIMILQRASWEFYINWSIEPSLLRYKVVLMIEMCVYERGMSRWAGVLYKKWIIVNLSNQLSHHLSRKVWYVWEVIDPHFLNDQREQTVIEVNSITVCSLWSFKKWGSTTKYPSQQSKITIRAKD